MKAFYSLLTLLAVHSLAYSDIIIQGVDFTKHKSIKRTLDGINTFRSSQSVILHLGQNETIKILDAFSDGDLSLASIAIGEGGSVRFNQSEQLTWNSFLERISQIKLGVKASGSNYFPLLVSFDETVSGTEGLTRLKALSSHNVQIVMVRVPDNKKSKVSPQPSAPTANSSTAPQ